MIPSKREILRWDPLPTAEAAYVAVRKETAHQNILGGTQQGVTSRVKLTDDLDGIGLVSNGRRSDQKFNSSSSRIDKTKLKCENCGMTKHTKEQCFEIVGYPDWLVGNKKGEVNMDIRTGKIIGRGTERQGLYYVDEVATQQGTVMRAHGSTDREACPSKRHIFTTMNCAFFETEYFYNTQYTGQGEKEYNDALSWLKWMSSSEETSHTSLPQSTDPGNSTTNNDLSILMSKNNKSPESSNNETEQHPSNNEIEQHSSQVDQIEEEPVRYELPPRTNRAKIDTIRVLFSIAINKGWPLHQFDVTNAFLHGELKDEVYMDPPLAFVESSNPREVCHLKKSLYGLKQSPRAWFGRFTLAMTKYGFKQSNSNHTLFLKRKGKLITCLIIYVNDMISTGNDEEEITRLRTNLFKEFEMKDLGRLKYFLGIEVLRYLKGTPGHVVLFKANGHLETQVYTDADWAGDKGNRRSTSGYFTIVGGNLVTWRSKKQKVVALSSDEAEFRGIARGLAEALWIRKLLSEIGYHSTQTSKIMCDNKAAIQISKNLVQHDRTRHIELVEIIRKLKTYEERIKFRKESQEDNSEKLLLTRQRNERNYKRNYRNGRRRGGNQTRGSGKYRDEGHTSNESEETNNKPRRNDDKSQIDCYKCGKLGH
nr:putative ribonuclease H-like domain-containing protein [Tanacetum cinerariifolium]